jgi:hypothetical protein
MGDVIQLATGSTGSGIPAVRFSIRKVASSAFSSPDEKADAITYAVPIRYGKEFLAGE